MNILAAKIADIIWSRVEQSALDSQAEVRLIFHGPPLEILEQTFQVLKENARGHERVIPVLLQVPELGLGEFNPPSVGISGRCTPSHLLNVRNSPLKPSYVALVPPGQHSNKSVSSTSDEFGVLASNSSGNIPFEVWWEDEFIQELVGIGLSLSGISDHDRDDARLLVAHAAEAADEADDDRTSKARAWRVISRLFASFQSDFAMSPASRVSLALGFPPMSDGSLSLANQVAILKKIRDALSDGFNSGISRAQEDASDVDVTNLSNFLIHLKTACDRTTAFERAAAAYYAPYNKLEVGVVPDWWKSLTVEKWSELLSEDEEAIGSINMCCSNAIFPSVKGMPVIVESEVELSFGADQSEASGVVVSIERTPKSPGGKNIGQLQLSDNKIFVDPSPPSHQSPMRYIATADHFKPGAIKVISLATWAPGILVSCKLAKKLTPPKRRKGRSGPNFETGLVLSGAGRYELIVFSSPNVKLDNYALGSLSDAPVSGDAVTKIEVRRVREGQFQVEVELDGNYQLDLSFDREGPDGNVTRESCRVVLLVEEVHHDGCRSEFERLIRLNRRIIQPDGARSIVQVDRNPRCFSLQDWILSADLIEKSYQPIVIADDYINAWVQPDWSEQIGPILSKGRFHKDPRPMPSEFLPPKEFIESRAKIAAQIRGVEGNGIVESAQLGKWLKADANFRDAVERYLESYKLWLSAEPDIACWIDVVAVVSLEKDGRTLSRVPDAVLLSPIHPLRLAWHSFAQNVLLEADDQDKPCPAAGILDPDCVPDIIRIAMRSPGGVEHINFVAVENGSDYWSVLWNGQLLRNLPERSQRSPFGVGFGISAGGISSAFSAAQVGRALDDVSDLLSAKSTLGITLTSVGGSSNACNEGLIRWFTSRYQQDEGRVARQSVGHRLVNIFDDRSDLLKPDDAQIANLIEDTQNKIRWFNGQFEGVVPDLGIITQLNVAEACTSPIDNHTPLGLGALIRHRIRRQLPEAFLNETRQGLQPEISGDAFADKIAACVAMIENLGQESVGISFAPNKNAIHDMFEQRKTDFVAVSSSAIDPACFLGGWLEGSYLWDYDLPAYSHRAGDTSGYYLLSRVRDADLESLSKALSKLPGVSSVEHDKVQHILLEIARRGIPTVRGLTGDDSGATGDLGLFVAARLLQDRFRSVNGFDSLLPVLNGSSDNAQIAIIVPVDPFQRYLSDLARTTQKKSEVSLMRPDLLVVGVCIDGTSVRIHLTPIEVKCRTSSSFPASEVLDALEQGKSMSRLLSSMLKREDQPYIWSLTFQHLLLSIISFGMRVYSQHDDIKDQMLWSRLHQLIASAILSEACDITVDDRGRLIAIDASPSSNANDRDNDRFQETITISLEDAGIIIAGDPSKFYHSIKEKVGNWELLPKLNVAKDLPVQSQSEKLDGPADAEDASQALPLDNIDPVENVATVRENVSSKGVILKLGQTVDGFQPRSLELNISNTELNHLNMGIVGDLGTGKTQLLKSLIMQISNSKEMNRGVRPSFLIFDYKRDYSSPDFVEATGARVVRPENLPINLFDTTTMEETTAPWLHRFRFFADVLDKIYTGIGAVQRDKLKRAVRTAYESTLDGSPTLYDIHRIYLEMMDGKSDSILAIIDDLVDMQVFATDIKQTVPFSEFLDGVVVISLDALGQDDRSKNMLVAIMLNLFYENMLKTNKKPFLGTNPQLRAVESYLLVDEADNIMRYEFDVLRKLLLQGREFGTGIILASQYLNHFKVNATDYRSPLLTWFVHKVPNTTQVELSALGLTGQLSDLAERVKVLPNHQCLYKSFDVSGEIIRGLPFFEFIQGKNK